MDRLPESRTLSTLAIAITVIASWGCRTQSSSMANPFLAPDRVPPPSTRPAIAPGTAQPYYPGDPMPAAQAAPPAQPITPIAAATTAPAAAAASAATPPGPPPTSPPPTTQSPLAFSPERTVSIPTDDQDLRFALPQAEQTPVAAMAAPAVAATQPQPAVAPAAAQATTLANQFPVSPAVYNNATPQDITPIGADMPPATGMWRAPQVPANGSMSQASQASYNMPVQGAPPVAAPQITPPPPPQPIVNPNPMPVQLRAATPPATQPMVQPVYNPPPRMRFPNFFGWGTQPQPMAAPPQPAPQVAAPTTSDGFRPRSSTR